jgi:import inner membrane translocase subunit TIM10
LEKRALVLPLLMGRADTVVRSSCHSKCINQRYLDGELSKGESVCVDRCVAKFFDANKKMGEKLQAMGAGAGAAGGFASL